MTGSLGCDNQGKMPRMLDPFQFVLFAVAGWMTDGPSTLR
jgi:hypothetical protein